MVPLTLSGVVCTSCPPHLSGAVRLKEVYCKRTQPSLHTLGLNSLFLFYPLSISQIDIRFLCVCPVIDHEFRHNIVKVAVDPR